MPEKIKLHHVLVFSLGCATIVVLAITASGLFIPKFIPNGNHILDYDFETKKDLHTYLHRDDLPDPDTSKNGAGIIESGSEKKSVLMLEGSETKAAFVYWILPKNNTMEYLELSCDVRLIDVVPEEKKYPRIWLYCEDGNGKKNWNIRHFISLQHRFTFWQRIDRYFYIPAETEKIHLRLTTENVTGRLLIDSLRLTPSRINPSFGLYRIILGAMVFVSGMFILIKFHTYTRLFWKQILICLFITSGVLLPKRFYYPVISTSPFLKSFIEDGGHFLLFFILSLLLFTKRDMFSYKNSRQYLLLHIITLTILAVATELLQYFTFSRSMSLIDLFIDIAGIAAGLAAGLLFIRLRYGKKKAGA